MSHSSQAAFGAAPATTPPDLAEWDPQWSRIVTVPTFDGERSFHVLDTLPALRERGLEPTGTIVALHGNPTWSYLWRRLAQATVDAAGTPGSRTWRVIAPDQLEMGYSERVEHSNLPTPLGDDPTQRRIAQRVTDFDAVISELTAEVSATSGADHPLVTLGHDWGGVLSLTWAARNQNRVAAVMTLNTAVWHDDNENIPAALRAALTGPVLPYSTVRTDAFLRATLALSNSIPPEVANAYRSPYQTAAERHGIGQFVADIPATSDHPSHGELQALARDIATIEAPALILWGPKDPVFQERYLRDLRERLPQADIHRFERTSHLFAEDVDYASTVLQWLAATLPVDGTQVAGAVAGGAPGVAGGAEESASDAAANSGTNDDLPMIFDALDARHTDPSVASVDMSKDQAISWAQLSHVVDAIALSLQEKGLKRGDRVSLLVPPGNNLTAAAYAVLKAGGVVVVADAGLGAAGMTRAIKASDPQWIIGEVPGLTLARGAGWPGRRISVTPLNALSRRLLGVETSMTEMSRRWVKSHEKIDTPHLDDDAAVLFTSGSTGPAKGVRYTHRALGALATVLQRHFDVKPGTGLVAGFPPFALLGPGIGASSVTPNMSVTKPRTLTARALAEAVAAGSCTMVFASPAAYTNVAATADELTDEQREACAGVEMALSAGAPVPLELMRKIKSVFPNASVHSPYGMTEGLLLADITAQGVAEAKEADSDHGVCVGRPIEGVRFAIAPILPDGTSSEELIELTSSTGSDATASNAVGVLGEFVVSADHIKSGYDRLWLTDVESKRDTAGGHTWHRTNDIGHVDAHGRIWVEGRTQHIVTTPYGPVAPGGVEAVVDTVPEVSRSAVVGVGPHGNQALVVVLERTGDMKPGLASLDITAQIRETVLEKCDLDVAAVLVAKDFLTDIRHNSKINREQLREWAEAQLG
ncbi:alpha/beta fold hydrolase [Brevibacterium sp. UMB10442]|nr:alpha/beta fold hydrolase [Brevibacterium sp. UMB10442]